MDQERRNSIQNCGMLNGGTESSMVEQGAHNALEVGSIPTQSNLLHGGPDQDRTVPSTIKASGLSAAMVTNNGFVKASM